MLDAIIGVATWFFLISGVIAWAVFGFCFWLYNLDRR